MPRRERLSWAARASGVEYPLRRIIKFEDTPLYDPPRRKWQRMKGRPQDARRVQVAVILVGDELLAGHTRDANAHYLAQRLATLGHRLRRISVVPDEARAIHMELDHVMPLADVVVVSGGLGPTHDDRTTEALAERFNRRLVVDDASWQRLLARYGQRADANERTRESARKMVTVPEGAEVLENPVGAACGYVVREGASAIVVLPGVPAEFQAIFEQAVVGDLLPTGMRTSVVEVDIEMAEAAFAHALSEVAQVYADIEIGSYPHHGHRHVTLRFKGDEKRAREALETFLDRVPEARKSIVRST